ncbi:MAG: RDD family protein [Bacteroidia bacterium]
MQTVEITTTQNVVIQVKLASLSERIIAFFVDFIVMIILYYFVVVIIFYRLIEIEGDGYDTKFRVWIMIFYLILSLYSLLFETVMGGKSPGKAVLGIKVVKADGGQPSFIDYFRRWVLRWIDIWGSLGMVAVGSIQTSNISQRIGDKLADTIVVKTKMSSGYDLKDILALKSSKSYKPKYPEVVQLSESYMIDIKRLLQRKRSLGSANVYSQIINDESKYIQTTLDIKKGEKNNDEFLQQILKDYVVLTR